MKVYRIVGYYAIDRQADYEKDIQLGKFKFKLLIGERVQVEGKSVILVYTDLANDYRCQPDDGGWEETIPGATQNAHGRICAHHYDQVKELLAFEEKLVNPVSPAHSSELDI